MVFRNSTTFVVVGLVLLSASFDLLVVMWVGVLAAICGELKVVIYIWQLLILAVNNNYMGRIAK